MKKVAAGQITIKLNKERFRPLLDLLNGFCPIGSDSDLVGRCIFFTYYANCIKQKNGKTIIQNYYDDIGTNYEEDLGRFLIKYAEFKNKNLNILLQDQKK